MPSRASKPISACALTELLRPVPIPELDEAVRLTSSGVWEALRGQSLFLTGGTGFVGKWLLECLLHANRVRDLGVKLAVLTRDPDRFRRTSPWLATSTAVNLVQGDVTDFSFPGGSFMAVVHAALPVMPAGSAAEDLKALAERGARRACEFAVASGARRFLHISSGAVYGTRPDMPALLESLPRQEAATANDYARAKCAAEDIVGQAWPFEVVVARCFAFIGPYLQGASGVASAQFIEQAAQGEGIVVRGSGEAVRTYQYGADMARWLLSLLALGGAGRTYNVGGASEVTIAQLAREVTRLAGTGLPVRIAGEAAPGLAGSRYVPSLRRAEDELGLTNVVGLEEAIRRTLSWCAAPVDA